MHLLKILLVACLLLTSTSSFADFSCKKVLSRLEKCDASAKFIHDYEMICREGNELSPADMTAILKSFDYEAAQNPCIARVYREPRTDRKARSATRKEARQFIKEQREERRQERAKAKAKAEAQAKANK